MVHRRETRGGRTRRQEMGRFHRFPSMAPWAQARFDSEAERASPRNHLHRIPARRCNRPEMARPAGLGLREPKAKQTPRDWRAWPTRELARPGGLEPATPGLEGLASDRLSIDGYHQHRRI